MTSVDILIVGAGPVGLMCAYLAQRCGFSFVILDKSEGPLQKGRADALNARTLQLLEIANLFPDLYPIGKPCHTSSIWEKGRFTSRQSSWWTSLEGCFHKHFLMIGQAHVEQLLVKRLNEMDTFVRRQTQVCQMELGEESCVSSLSTGEWVQSRYVIGADGAHSWVRKHFQIPFELASPRIIWAVVDGVLDTDFPKVPEIIVFQNETSDVAWIPREGNLDRFYIRMDKEEFTWEEVMEKIQSSLLPHSIAFKEIQWYSQFQVREGVAESFSLQNRIFLAGDACHVHSVNGGLGLNTGLGDAFNLIWKLHMHQHFGFPNALLSSYQSERQPVAKAVVGSSAQLVRSTKYSHSGTHAQDYVQIVEERSGHITGMGVRYRDSGRVGTRVHDLKIHEGPVTTRLYSLLNYETFSLFVFDQEGLTLDLPSYVKVFWIQTTPTSQGKWTPNPLYANQTILVRPDGYLENWPLEFH